MPKLYGLVDAEWVHAAYFKTVITFLARKGNPLSKLMPWSSQNFGPSCANLLSRIAETSGGSGAQGQSTGPHHLAGHKVFVIRRTERWNVRAFAQQPIWKLAFPKCTPIQHVAGKEPCYFFGGCVIFSVHPCDSFPKKPQKHAKCPRGRGEHFCCFSCAGFPLTAWIRPSS